jgi:hypothetical protein
VPSPARSRPRGPAPAPTGCAAPTATPWAGAALREIAPTHRDIYYQCANLFCGHSWKASETYDYGIAPSAIPNPRVTLPGGPSPGSSHRDHACATRRSPNCSTAPARRSCPAEPPLPDRRHIPASPPPGLVSGDGRSLPERNARCAFAHLPFQCLQHAAPLCRWHRPGRLDHAPRPGLVPRLHQGRRTRAPVAPRWHPLAAPEGRLMRAPPAHFPYDHDRSPRTTPAIPAPGAWPTRPASMRSIPCPTGAPARAGAPQGSQGPPRRRAPVADRHEAAF